VEIPWGCLKQVVSSLEYSAFCQDIGLCRDDGWQSTCCGGLRIIFCSTFQFCHLPNTVTGAEGVPHTVIGLKVFCIPLLGLKVFSIVTNSIVIAVMSC